MIVAFKFAERPGPSGAEQTPGYYQLLGTYEEEELAHLPEGEYALFAPVKGKAKGAPESLPALPPSFKFDRFVKLPEEA